MTSMRTLWSLSLLFFGVFFFLSTNTIVFTHAHLPAGFVDVGVGRVRQAVDVTFLPTTNDMLVPTKEGQLHRMDSDTGETQLLLDWTDRVCDNGERGLQSVVVHPQFGDNDSNKNYLYLFYTYNRGDPRCDLDGNNGPVNRVSRVTMDPITLQIINPNTEVVLLETVPLPDRVHNGGMMLFGKDGYLYVAIGDAGQRSEQWAQLRHNLLGTLVRITEDGTVPSDNPYADTGVSCASGPIHDDDDVVCSEIFAYGLRNPFRFVLDPHTPLSETRFLIGDVGGRVWEEVDVAGTRYAGANYGWPSLEGVCQYDRANRCPSTTTTTLPLYWYQHDQEESGCIVGPAIVPPNLQWPPPYNDPSSFFIADHVWGTFFHVTPSATSDASHGFANTTLHEWPRPVSLKFGPYQSSTTNTADHALYYVTRRGNLNVRRIVYVGGNNFAPVAKVTAHNIDSNEGGSITFDASGTVDRNHPHEELDFEWNFKDGSNRVTVQGQPIIEHTYTEVGVYDVELVVSDPNGASSRTWVEVSVGVLPTVEITRPAEGTRFAVGDVFTLEGRATDFRGRSLPDSSLAWAVRQIHNNHYHPFLARDTEGNNIELSEAPEPEDFHAATNSYLEVLLTGTDDRGISQTVSRIILPKTVLLDFDSRPSGLTLTLDEQERTTPVQILSWENHNLRARALDQGIYRFVEWQTENGGVVSVGDSPTVADDVPIRPPHDTIVVPPNSTTIPRYIAIFEQVEGAVEPSMAPATAPSSSPTGRPVDTTIVDEPTAAPSSLAPTARATENKSLPPEGESPTIASSAGSHNQYMFRRCSVAALLWWALV